MNQPDQSAPQAASCLAFALSFTVAAMVAGWFVAIPGQVGPRPALLTMVMFGAVFAAAAASGRRRRRMLRRYVEQQAQQAAAVSQAQAERAALEVAARNNGYVTPSRLVMQARGLTLQQARELLEELAQGGFCELEPDARGDVYYRFSVGRTPERTDLSPEAWVDSMSQRMTGEAEQRQSNSTRTS